MGAHGVTDCRECVVCGGHGFQRLRGKAGRVPGAGRDSCRLGKVAVCQECGHSVRRAQGSRGAWEAQPGGMWGPFKSTQKAWLLSSFTRACLGGSGHLELGGMLHSNKHSEDFNPQHVLFMFCKAFSSPFISVFTTALQRQAEQTSSTYYTNGITEAQRG